MRVLGLGTEGDSGAAIIEDGRILAAGNEERLCRLKLLVGFPRDSIREVLRASSTRVAELDLVLIGAREDVLVDRLQPFHGWFHQAPAGVSGVIKRAAGTFAHYRRYLPFLEAAYYTMLAPGWARRRRGIRRILREELGFRCPIHFVDHHVAHLTSAYYTSGFEDALIVSIDGGGDRKSSRVYAVRNGRWERLHEISAYHSLGNYYAYVTHLCGFKAMKHEGKVTGLAAHGEPRYVPLLASFIDERDGTFINRAGVAHLGAVRELERRLPPGWTREDLAASIQRHTEDLVCRYIKHWARVTGLRNVALAGGVFANVRVNQEVHELPEVDSIFVHPHMGDGGLPAGAALAACMPGVLDRTMPYQPMPLEDAYLGPDLGESEVDAALRAHGLEPEPLTEPLEEIIADLLMQGYVVARAEGRMEYGPRALGNRSILYHPTDATVNDWLNRNLHRTEFMPIAPSVLYEERDRCFEGVSGAEHAAEFMTVTFDCTPWMQRAMPGVVHIDGTARPQLVRKDRNPRYHRIIEAFHRRTGLPAIINTSFNMHEEPIVCSADDCVRAFLEGNLDYLAVGGRLVKHPRATTRRLTPARADRAIAGSI